MMQKYVITINDKVIRFCKGCGRDEFVWILLENIGALNANVVMGCCKCQYRIETYE